MPVLFLNYRRGTYTVASGKLVDTYEDSWGERYFEIAVAGGYVHLTQAFIVTDLSAAA